MADTALIVGAMAGAVALLSTAANFFNARSIERIKAEGEEARIAAEDKKEISIYSEALARAAFDLQSRIFNILHRDFVGIYLRNGTEREKSYAVENTVFLIAQFLCWVELIRREINFIQLKDSRSTKRLLRVQDDVYDSWGTDKWPQMLRLFAGEQRALGEALIVGDADYTTCMGYGRFLKELSYDDNEIIDYLKDNIKQLPSMLKQARARLTTIQHLLIEIIDIIDPDGLRFPQARRSKA